MEIVQDGAPVLRAKAKPVAESEFGTKAFNEELEAMITSLDAQADGVALAAPQIGISKRIFIVRYDRMAPPVPEGEPEREAELGVYVNPEFVRKARKRSEMDEGCLSVRGKYGKTKRAERATVRAQDAQGKKFERGGGGILAQAFQHEIDHLDGILFIDHATHIVDVEVDDLPKKPRRQTGWIASEDAHA
jgi:peptide deformylase